MSFLSSINPISAGIDLITSIIGRVWPDKTEQEKAQLAAAMQADNNLTKLLAGQMDINAAEAANSNLFVSGWRPFIGWVCGLAFAWQFILCPMVVFITGYFHYSIPIPIIDNSAMNNVLMGMLGLGTLRTYEKIKGAN